MAYINQEKVENAKTEIIDRMQMFIDEYKRYSESTVDYHYGKAEWLEVAKRLVKSILTDLIEQPTADVVEVKHGNWIRYTEDIHRYGIREYECSECGSCMDYEGDYCSKCGAKMEGLITRWRR